LRPFLPPSGQPFGGMAIWHRRAMAVNALHPHNVTVLGRHATRRIRLAVIGVLIGLLAALAPHGATPANGSTSPMVNVIVQQWNGADTGPGALVASLGGQVTRQLPVVAGFAATVPADSVATLIANPGIRVVSPDHPVYPQLTSTAPSLAERPSVYRETVGATAAATRGFTGAGATVAIIDTGVTNVPQLAGRLRTVTDAAGNASLCLNLSIEPGCQDSYGHGTFVAGMVNGTAPDASILAIKLSGRDGLSNVSTVLAAVGWVIENRDAYDIDVLNMSLRTDSTLSYRFDPLNLAVERAWLRGITVVVSAGNQGPDARTIAKPADDPWVLSVGAVDDAGTATVLDDAPAGFSSRGPTFADNLAKPDVAAPGKSVVSLRSPGSAADTDFPYFVNDVYRRGSGTSFAAPVVAGAAAVFLQAHPTATNNRVKFALRTTARAGGTADAVGRGVIDVNAALDAPAGLSNQTLFHPLLCPCGIPTLTDAAGLVYMGASFEGTNWQGTNWQGTNWQGTNWQGTNWQGTNWQGTNWQGTNWQAGYWS